MKYDWFSVLLTLGLITACLVWWIYAIDGVQFLAGAFALCVLYVAGLKSASEARYEKNSYLRPSRLSGGDVGMMFCVAEVRDGKIALLPWGVTATGLGIQSHVKTYYVAEQIPLVFRRRKSLFAVRVDECGKLVVREITVHGYMNDALPPFEFAGEPLPLSA